VLVSPKIRGKARAALIEAARAGQDLDEDQARYVRVIEYEVPDREGDGKGELIAPGHHDHADDRGPQPRYWQGPTISAGNTRSGTPSSRRTCAAPGGCCGPGARTWSARRSTATCSPTTRSVP